MEPTGHVVHKIEVETNTKEAGKIVTMKMEELANELVHVPGVAIITPTILMELKRTSIPPHILKLVERLVKLKEEALKSMMFFKCQSCKKMKPLDEAILLEIHDLPFYPFFTGNFNLRTIDEQFTLICNQCELMVSNTRYTGEEVFVYKLYISDFLVGEFAFPEQRRVFSIALPNEMDVNKEPSPTSMVKLMKLHFGFTSVIRKKGNVVTCRYDYYNWEVG